MLFGNVLWARRNPVAAAAAAAGAASCAQYGRPGRGSESRPGSLGHF